MVNSIIKSSGKVTQQSMITSGTVWTYSRIHLTPSTNTIKSTLINPTLRMDQYVFLNEVNHEGSSHYDLFPTMLYHENCKEYIKLVIQEMIDAGKIHVCNYVCEQVSPIEAITELQKEINVANQLTLAMMERKKEKKEKPAKQFCTTCQFWINPDGHEERCHPYVYDEDHASMSWTSCYEVSFPIHESKKEGAN